MGTVNLTQNSWPSCAPDMEADLTWLPAAQNDVKTILAYLEQESPKAGPEYVSALTTVAESLRQFPMKGRAYTSRFRVLVFRNHLILYRYKARKRQVDIVRVIDGRRDVKRLLRGSPST